MTTTITLEPPAEFLNANQRYHWRKKAELTAAWREATKSAALRDRVGYWTVPVHITFSVRWPDKRRRDPGNWYPTAKACVDGLVDAEVLYDDSDAYVVGPDMRRHIPNGSPLVTITISPLEDQ